LLDVLDSPIRAAAERVVEGSLSGDPAPDEALIALDEYCQAVAEPVDVYHPVYLQSCVASLAILVSEAQRPRYYRQPRSPYHEAESVWQTFDGSLARARGVSALSLSETAFAERERTWQAADQQAVASGVGDPSALSRHLDLLRSGYAAARAELANLVSEFGWTPGGPCGDLCDWPSCGAAASGCVRKSPFQQTLAAELRRRNGAEPKTWYLQVFYERHAKDEPDESLSEISPDGYELRKVAYYGDEHTEWVDANGGRGTLALSGEPVPAFTELDESEDFFVEEITAKLFEKRWAEARENPRRPFLAG
jgi:hypothetical protein